MLIQVIEVNISTVHPILNVVQFKELLSKSPQDDPRGAWEWRGNLEVSRRTRLELA
jgi:hypothetical protein